MNEDQILSDVLKGDADAVEFCSVLASISQTWDDLVDRDREVTPGDVTMTFFASLVDLPANPFYRKHFDRLHPILTMVIYDYAASVELERASIHDRTIAFVLRDSYCALVTQCAAIVGGHSWALAQAARIRRAWHDDTLSDYLKELPP